MLAGWRDDCIKGKQVEQAVGNYCDSRLLVQTGDGSHQEVVKPAGDIRASPASQNFIAVARYRFFNHMPGGKSNTLNARTADRQAHRGGLSQDVLKNDFIRVKDLLNLGQRNRRERLCLNGVPAGFTA